MQRTLQIFVAILLTVAILSSMVACTSPQNHETEDTVTVYLRTDANRYRDNNEISNSWKFSYDSIGNLLSVSGRDGEGKEYYHIEHEYDNENNVKLTTFNYDRLEKFCFRYEYEYNSSGSKKTTYSDGDLHSEEEYDCNSKITSSIDYHKDGTEIWRRSNYEYEYDGNGNIILEIRYDDGIEMQRIKYEYDNKSNIMLEVRYDNGIETKREEFEYDENGRKTLYVLHEKGVETICEEYKYEFAYSNNGNVTLEICYCNGKASHRYEYDGNGVKKLEVRYSDGEEFERVEYDKNGCPIQYTFHGSSGTSITTFQYKELTLSRQQAEKVAKQEFLNIAFFIDLPLVIISE